jgi:hypothetical protein
MSSELAHLTTLFFAAARALAWHTGSLQERLADAYADHLLLITGDTLPSELQPAFRELEERLTQAPADAAVDDPFQAATRGMSDEEARALIERILMLYGRLAGAATA